MYKLVYFTSIVCVRVDVRSCDNYVSANITSEGGKKSAFDLSFNPPISINVFPVVASGKFEKRVKRILDTQSYLFPPSRIRPEFSIP